MDWLFQKDPTELRIDDLRERLSDVPEGFYREYKGRDTIRDNAAIAKAIAAFANTYGGWLFIGIDSDDENKPLLDDPSKPLGLPKGKGATERIQEIAASQLSPGPHLVCVEIPVVPEDKDSDVILATYIEESEEPPLVRRRDGRIYVRDDNVSRPIKDKAELDRLYDKAAKNQELVRQRLELHNYGEWALSELHTVFVKLASILSHRGEQITKPDGYAVVLSYPWSPSFRSESVVGTMQDIYGGIMEGDPSLMSLLGRVGSHTYRDQHTAVFFAEGEYRALQVDKYGHIALGLLQPGARSADLQSLCPNFHACCEDLYRRHGYYGRVGLVYRLGGPGDRKAHLSRTVPAPQITQIDIEELVEEAARALGERDSRR